MQRVDIGTIFDLGQAMAHLEMTVALMGEAQAARIIAIADAECDSWAETFKHGEPQNGSIK